MKRLISLIGILLSCHAFGAERPYFGACLNVPVGDGGGVFSPEDPQAEEFLRLFAGKTELLIAHKLTDLWIDQHCLADDRAWIAERWGNLRQDFYVRVFWSAQAAIDDPARGAAELCQARISRLLGRPDPTAGLRLQNSVYPEWVAARAEYVGSAIYRDYAVPCADTRSSLERALWAMPRGNLRVPPAPVSEVDLIGARSRCADDRQKIEQAWQEELARNADKLDASFPTYAAEFRKARRQALSDESLREFNLSIADYPVLGYLDGPLQGIGSPEKEAAFLRRMAAAIGHLAANAQASIDEIHEALASHEAPLTFVNPDSGMVETIGADTVTRLLPMLQAYPSAVDIVLGDPSGANRRFCPTAQGLMRQLLRRQMVQSLSVSALSLVNLFVSPLVDLAIFLPIQAAGYFINQREIARMEHRLFLSVSSLDGLGQALRTNPISELEKSQAITAMLLPAAAGMNLYQLGAAGKLALGIRALKAQNFRRAALSAPPGAYDAPLDPRILDVIRKP